MHIQKQSLTNRVVKASRRQKNRLKIVSHQQFLAHKTEYWKPVSFQILLAVQQYIKKFPQYVRVGFKSLLVAHQNMPKQNTYGCSGMANTNMLQHFYQVCYCRVARLDSQINRRRTHKKVARTESRAASSKPGYKAIAATSNDDDA